MGWWPWPAGDMLPRWIPGFGFGFGGGFGRLAASAQEAAASAAAPQVPSAQDPPSPDAPGSGPPVSWRDQAGEGQLPPNLGPPPERLDWRRQPDDEE